MRTRSQRLLSMVLALSMLLTFLPLSAFAEGTPPPYTVSNADTQTLENNNTCTKPGEGTYTYTLNDDHTATLTKFTGEHANVPEKVTKGDDTYTVTAIGEYAFATKGSGKYDSKHYVENNKLQSINLPNTITEIGNHAFYYCTNDNFTSIKIPDDVTEIKEGTFYKCRSLKNVTLPQHLKTIGDYAFSECTDLTSITLSEAKDLTAIGQGAFLSEAKDLTTIGQGAFTSCTNLSKVILPEGLTTVGHAAFALTKLTDVTIPKSLKEVGVTAFASSPDPIKTITYHGTETAWNTLLSSNAIEGGTVGASNPQLTSATNYYYAHTVTFNANGHGTDPEDQEVQYEGYATEPEEPKPNATTADGFTFKGWYTASEGGEKFDFKNSPITKDKTLYAHWEVKKTDPTPENPGNTDKPTDKPDDNKTDTDKPNTDQTTPSQKPEQTTPPEAPAVEEDDTAAIGYAAAAVTAAFVGWGAYRIGSEVYLKYLLPKDVLLPQNRIQLAELLWEDAGRPAPADAAPYTDVDADDTDARQAARWAVENGLLTLPDTEKPEEFAPYRSVSYAKSARAWNKAQQLKENAAAR